MTSKIEVPRELLERAESILGSQGFSAWSEISDQLRALLATPEAPRQEPVGRVSYIGNGFIRVRCAAPPALESLLYAAPLSPDHSGGGAGMVVLPERECEDCFQNDQSEQAIGFNRALDKVKELNQ